ncbi:MAG: hypothetical protein ACHQM6_05155 [Candidatus Kapaibacterium sp.]
MKKSIVAAILLLSLSSCSDKSKGFDQVAAQAGSPSAVVLGLFKSMSAEDSVAIMNSLTHAAQERILPQIEGAGGFVTLFHSMKGMKYDTKILWIDSASGTAKVFVRQTFDQDSSVHLKIDSLYYSLVTEEGVWKLTSLNAKKLEPKP